MIIVCLSQFFTDFLGLTLSSENIESVLSIRKGIKHLAIDILLAFALLTDFLGLTLCLLKILNAKLGTGKGILAFGNTDLLLLGSAENMHRFRILHVISRYMVSREFMGFNFL